MTDFLHVCVFYSEFWGAASQGVTPLSGIFRRSESVGPETQQEGGSERNRRDRVTLQVSRLRKIFEYE